MRRLAQLTLAALLTAGIALNASAKNVQVKAYTKKDGTIVPAHTRHVADSDKQKVKSYTRKDGTVVQGYEPNQGVCW